jgi:hypothetical protein
MTSHLFFVEVSVQARSIYLLALPQFPRISDRMLELVLLWRGIFYIFICNQILYVLHTVYYDITRSCLFNIQLIMT